MAEEETSSQKTLEKALPTQGANHFAAAVNITEILITLGQSRVIMENLNGIPTPVPAPEWFLTLSISPSAANQLQQILSAAINAYEQQHGKIPSDAKFQINTNKAK